MKLGIFVLGILMLGIFVSGEANVDREILDRFDRGDSVVDVVVALRENSFRVSADSVARGSPDRKLSTIRVNRKELRELMMRDDFVGVETLRYFEAYLDESVGLLNASPTWNLKVSGINLTGFSQGVCVIDTGINYSHPDILGRNLTACNIDCIDKTCVENCSEEDLNGHGTHVAGIVGASGGIDGIAGGVGLIGLKVFPGSSKSGATTVGIVNAIDWCVDNSETYNISVISMSLGTDALFSSTCDSSFGATFAPSVNAAFIKNISVVAASGNDGNLTAIGSPACLSKVIAVGGADKSGGMYSFSNRNSLVSLLGIALLVNSTDNGGGYVTLSGTSMATPMISGAIAIINQLLSSTSRTMTPLEIEDMLNDTGELVDDNAGSGYNFSRINVYDAVLSLDNIVPDVELVSPVDNHVNLSVNQSFVCNATDWQITNVTFRIWNSSGLYFNESRNLTGEANESSFDLVDLAEGDYNWNCEAWDVKGNFGEVVSNFSLTVAVLEVSPDSPVNNSYTNVNETNFSCSAQSDAAYGLENMTFRIWNSSGVLIFNESENISGVSNVTNFSYTFLSDGNYSWGCVVLNNNSDSQDSVNFSISYDATEPVISGLSTSVTTSSAVISWATNESSNSSVWVSGGSWSNSSDYVLSHSVSVSVLTASSDYTYVVWSCDRASNCVNNSGSFRTDDVVSSGGGGGSSSSSVVTSIEEENVSVVYDVGEEEISFGYTNGLRENDSLNFRVNDYGGGRHLLTVEKVGEDYVDIVIHSEPVGLRLFVGEDRKLNLSSPDYYDLIVRLNGVLDGVADLSVQRIRESVVVTELVVVEVSADEVDYLGYRLLVLGLTLVLGLVVFVLNRKKVKKRKRKNKKKGARRVPGLIKNNGKNKKVKA